MDDLKTINGRIRFARKRLKIRSAREGARKLGLNEETYVQYENGIRLKDRIPSDVLLNIADGYKVNPLWLLTGLGDPSDPIPDESVRRFMRAISNASPRRRERAYRILEQLLEEDNE